MAALLQIGVRRKGFNTLLQSIAQTQAQLRAPLAGAAGVRVEAAMRAGVKEQFERGGDPAWTPTHPLGEWQPAPTVLGGTGGRVYRAWAQAPAEKGPREVRLRLDDKVALAHHRGAIIKPVKHPSAMQSAIGRKTGFWFSQKRLQQGLVLPKRPVLFTQRMLLAAQLAAFAGFQGTGR